MADRRRHRWSRRRCDLLSGGAFANVGLLYLIGPAADACYIFPSNVFCAFVIALAVAVLPERRKALT